MSRATAGVCLATVSRIPAGTPRTTHRQVSGVWQQSIYKHREFRAVPTHEKSMTQRTARRRGYGSQAHLGQLLLAVVSAKQLRQRRVNGDALEKSAVNVQGYLLRCVDFFRRDVVCFCPLRYHGAVRCADKINVE